LSSDGLRLIDSDYKIKNNTVLYAVYEEKSIYNTDFSKYFEYNILYNYTDSINSEKYNI
jgi:hypothetical protein